MTFESVSSPARPGRRPASLVRPSGGIVAGQGAPRAASPGRIGPQPHVEPPRRSLVAVAPSGPAPRRGRFGTRTFLPALDLLAVAGGIAGTTAAGTRLGTTAPVADLLLFGAILVVLLWLCALRRSRLTPSLLDDLPGLTKRLLVAIALTVALEIVLATTTSSSVVVERQFLWGAAVTGLAVAGLRVVGYTVVRRLRARGMGGQQTLVIGAGRVGAQVADVLQAHPEYGLNPIGFLDDDPADLGRSRLLPVLGRPDQLPRILELGRVSTVVVAFSSMKESEMVNLIRTCDRFRCEVFIVPRLFEVHHVDASMDNAWGFPLVRLRRATYRSRAWRLKRLVDVLVSSLLLLATLPVLLVLALAVRLDTGPGVFFRQERVGVDGHSFAVLKFRTFRPTGDLESATAWSIADDPRLSRVGRFLRTTSLDELPQLINILRGDMSLVGPRPERPFFVSQFRTLYPSYEARHRVPSGLTGWAQVHGLRGDTSIADRARFDNYYIENWSLWLDVKIILRTVGCVLRGAGR